MKMFLITTAALSAAASALTVTATSKGWVSAACAAYAIYKNCSED